MDLSASVILKKKPMNYAEYAETVTNERASSINWLRSDDVRWNVSDSLKIKIKDERLLGPFYGDTVVLPLKSDDIASVDEFQAILRQGSDELFAEPLEPAHFHITLHDLTSSKNSDEIEAKTEENRRRCEEIFRNIASYLSKNPRFSSIRMNSMGVYPSCNISAVLGYIPASDADYRILMNLYNLFDDVVYLSYWLRAHITLSYFRPVEFDGKQISSLLGVLDRLEEKKSSISLDLWELSYQRFTSMNSYETVFSLKDFR